jgi:hypothetical protein
MRRSHRLGLLLAVVSVGVAAPASSADVHPVTGAAVSKRGTWSGTLEAVRSSDTNRMTVTISRPLRRGRVAGTATYTYLFRGEQVNCTGRLVLDERRGTRYSLNYRANSGNCATTAYFDIRFARNGSLGVKVRFYGYSEYQGTLRKTG